MKNKILVVAVLLLSAAIFVAALPKGTQTAQAAVTPGDPACLAAAGSNPCLSITPEVSTIPLSKVGSTIQLRVNFSIVPTFAGWDVAIKTDASVLKPVSIQGYDPALGQVSVFTDCENSSGTGCGSVDGSGIAHSAATALGASDAGSGVLFNITYTVVHAGTTTVTFVNGVGPSVVSDPTGNTLIDCNATPTHCVPGTANVGPPIGFDYTLSNNGPVTIQPGQTGPVIITATLTAGTALPVTLACTGLPIGITCTIFTPNPVTPTAAGGTSTVQVIVASTVAAGDYTFQVAGTPAGATGGTTTVHVTVPAVGGLTLSASPASISTTTGTAGTSSIAASSTTLTGNVALSTNSTVCTLSMATIVVGTGSSTLSCTSTTAQNFHVDVTGTIGTVTQHVIVPVTISTAGTPSFTLTPSPTSVTCNTGASKTVTITAAAQGGFTGDIALAAPVITGGVSGGLSGSLSSSTITGGSGTSTLTLTCTTAGTYSVAVTGTSGTLAAVTATIPVTVTNPGGNPGFTLTASPTSLTCANTGGTSPTSTITLTGTNGFTGSASLTSSTLPSGMGVSGSLSPTSISSGQTSTLTVSCNGATPGSYTVSVQGSSPYAQNSVQVPVTVTGPAASFTLTAVPVSQTCVAGQSGTVMINVVPSGSFTGTVTLTPMVTPSTGLSATMNPTSVTGSGSATLNLTCTTAGSYNVLVTGTSGSLTPQTVTVPVSVTPPAQNKDFTLTVTPLTVQCTAGGTGTATVTVTPQNGYAETVQLASTITPTTGLTGMFSPTSITGGSGTSTLTFTCTTAGTYNVNVVGNGETRIHQTPITVNVSAPGTSSFTLTIAPSSVSCQIGGTGSAVVTLSPTGGTFSGTVTLSKSTSPSTGLGVTLSSSSSSVPGTANLSFQCNTAGTYTVTVTGTSGSTTKTGTVTVNVTSPSTGGFSLTVGSSSLTVLQGCSNTTSVSLTSLGFSGGLDLTVKVSPANGGVSADLSKIHTSIGVDATSHLVLTVSADSTATLGSYTVTVTAVGGSTTHTATVHVTVKANACTGQDKDHENSCDQQKGDDDDNQCSATDDHSVKSSDDKGQGSDHGASCKSDDNDDETGSNCGCPSVKGGEEDHEGNDQDHNVQTGGHENEDHGVKTGGNGDTDHGQKGDQKSGDNEKNKCSDSCSSNSENQKAGGEAKSGEHNAKSSNDNAGKGACDSRNSDISVRGGVQFSDKGHWN